MKFDPKKVMEIIKEQLNKKNQPKKKRRDKRS